jgi:hypothetical protein
VGGDEGGQAEVEAGKLAAGLRDCLRDGLEMSQARRALGVAPRELEDRRSPWIAARVERMAEAGNGLSMSERIGDEPGGIAR